MLILTTEPHQISRNWSSYVSDNWSGGRDCIRALIRSLYGESQTRDAFPTLCPTSLLSRETEPEAPLSVEIKGESLHWKLTLPDPFIHSASRIPAATVDFLGRGLEDSSVKKIEWPQNKDTQILIFRNFPQKQWLNLSPDYPPMTSINFQAPSKLTARSQLLSSSFLNVNGRREHQPWFQFLSSVVRGRSDSHGALPGLRCQLFILQPQPVFRAGQQPTVQGCSFWGAWATFQNTVLSFCKTCHPVLPSPSRNYLVDNILLSLFVKTGIYHNPFELVYLNALPSKPQWKIKYWNS